MIGRRPLSLKVSKCLSKAKARSKFSLSITAKVVAST